MITISRRTHSILDYVEGLLLVAAPWIFQFQDTQARGISITFGVIAIFYSLLTDYQLAILRFIPFSIHRAADVVWGGLLLFAPVHFAVTGMPAVIFVLTGAMGVAAALLTRGKFTDSGESKPLVPGL